MRHLERIYLALRAFHRERSNQGNGKFSILAHFLNFFATLLEVVFKHGFKTGLKLPYKIITKLEL